MGGGGPKPGTLFGAWVGPFQDLGIVQKSMFNNLYYVKHGQKVQFWAILEPFFRSGFFEVRKV